MLHPRPATLLLIAAVAVTTSCSSTPASPPGVDPATAPSSAATDPASTPAALEGAPGDFDINRVALMEPADLPESVPLPVPLGGEIDDSIGAFEGKILVVHYDPRFLQTAVAFYATWFELEGLAASPLLAMGGEGAGWEVDIDGAPVRVQLTMSTDSRTRLEILWD